MYALLAFGSRPLSYSRLPFRTENCYGSSRAVVAIVLLRLAAIVLCGAVDLCISRVLQRSLSEKAASDQGWIHSGWDVR